MIMSTHNPNLHPDPLAYPPALMSRPVVARYLGVSERQVHTLVQQGHIPPPRRLGDGSVRWVREEIDEAVRRLPVMMEKAG